MPRVARKKASTPPPMAEEARTAPDMVKREPARTPLSKPPRSGADAYLSVFAVAFLLGYGLGMTMPLSPTASMTADIKKEVANVTESIGGTSPIPMLQNFFRLSFSTTNLYQYLEAVPLNKADKEMVLALARENMLMDAYNPAVNLLEDARIIIRDQNVAFTVDLNNLDQYAVGINEALITDITSKRPVDIMHEVRRIVAPRIEVHTGVGPFEHPIGILVLTSVLQSRQHIICLQDRNACPR